MLKENDLLEYTNASILDDAKELYYAGHVGKVNMKRTNFDVIETTSNVKDARGYSLYQPSIWLNPDADQIIDYNCTCEAAQSNTGMCEHALSVVVKMIYDSLELPMKLPEETLQNMQTNEPSSWRRSTDEDLKQLIHSYALDTQVISPTIQNTGGIEVLPDVIFNDDQTMTLSLRIGPQGIRKYLVRNISTFATNVQTGAFEEYGKNLAFAHTKENFAKRSLPFIRFICKLNNLAILMHPATYYEPSYHGYQETITLSGELLDLFITSITTKNQIGQFIHVINQGSLKSIPLYDDLCDLQIELKEKNDGYQLSSMPFDLYKGEDYIYIKPKNTFALFRIELSNKNVLPFLIYLQKTQGQPQFLAHEDLPAFTKDVYPIVSKALPIESSSVDLQQYMPDTPDFEIYLDAPTKETITCRMEAVYKENKRFNLLNTDKESYRNRNLAEESKLDHLVSPWFNNYDEKEMLLSIQNNEEQMFNFLKNGLPILHEHAKVFVSDKLKALNIKTTPKFSIGVSVQSGLLKLDIGSEDLKPEELAEILSRYDEKKKYYRLKNGDFVDANEAIKELNQLQEGLQFTKKQLKDGNIVVPTYRALYLDQLSDHSDVLMMDRDAHFESLVSNMVEMSSKRYEVPQPLDGILRDYQKKGYSWLCSLKENGFCGLLADEMGLGKTVQVIAFVKGMKNRGRVLIVAPASLVYNWAAEFKHFASDLPVRIITGPSEERAQLIKESKEDDIVITSYDLLKRDINEYLTLEFCCEIIDEAQFIKNPKTKAARAVKGINSSFRLALTGTPIENRLSELWSIFDYLMPGFLYSYKQFQNELEYPIVLLQDDEARLKLQSMVAPFTLRRLKKDVLKDLPDKLEEVVYAPLTGEQKELYQAGVQNLTNSLQNESNDDFNKHKIEVLAEITKLRETCCSPALLYKNYQGNSAKEDLCMELIRRAVNSGHKVLLFSQFTSMLNLLVKRLEEESIQYHMLTGSTAKKERANLVEQFQNDDVPVFCISLKAGGTGLNLTAADIVIHYDPWWNTAAENQASDRAHRIGQESVVTVYRLILEGSIEEKILNMQKEKADLADGVLKDKSMATSVITKEDLLKLL